MGPPTKEETMTDNIEFPKVNETLSVLDFYVKRITSKLAKEYIRKEHYSKGSHNGPSPCYGLYHKDYGDFLIGALMFATPCSENVRSSVFGIEYKDSVVELHRLHVLDGTPKNTESYFIGKCLRNLVVDRPATRGVLSFADTTEGHSGVIYKATNAYSIGQTGKAKFYLDEMGRLRHPRQNGVNISEEEARSKGWNSVVRLAKNRYLWIIGPSVTERKKFKKICKLLPS
jgi:hypothetical protein